MIVEPGLFRTNFLNPQRNTLVSTKFPEYEALTKGLYDTLATFDRKQPGDPEKGVAAILDVVKQEGKAAGRGIPSRLMLGPDAVDRVKKECLETLELLKQWEDISTSTNADD
jgi:hypothetical protein